MEEQHGRTTVEHLNHLGVLGPNMLAVHTVWMTDQEIDYFRLHDVKVSHNPAAAMRVLGFAPDSGNAGTGHNCLHCYRRSTLQ
ncbi:hypothetical protein [Paenibacillus larvae]|uniref:hypothetical protein n=1 Tax=Paenibacillus larvae TaxID=1464 RepID=UPI002280C95A|nr:hypothetical protein [Paenibacillus larvae]